MNKKQNLLKALLNTIGQNKVCDSLVEINKAFDILEKAQKTDLVDKIEKIPNVEITTKQGNKEVTIELKAKFTKDILKLTKGN